MSDPLDEAVEHLRHAQRLLLRARPHVEHAVDAYPGDEVMTYDALDVLNAIDALHLERQRLGREGGSNLQRERP